MKIFIQSIPNEYSAFKLHALADPKTGKSLNKSKYGKAVDRLSALYSSSVGGLKNGLSYKPWLDENGQQKANEQGKLLTLQQREEQRWHMPDGYLTNRSWRRGDGHDDATRTYFQRQYWKFQDGTTALDITNNFDDAMCYYVAMDSKYVANSSKELRSNKWPFAKYFISIKNEGDEQTYEKNRRKIKAYAALTDKIMTKVWKERFAQILSLSSSLNNLTEEQIENLLYQFISTDNGSEQHNISKFNNLYRLMKTQDGKLELEMRHLLKQGIDTRIIYEKGETYTWNRNKGKIVLGERYEDAVAFLLNPKKDSFVEELKQEIKSKLI